MGTLIQNSQVKPESLLFMKIRPIPIFRDNYSYLLQCSRSNLSAVVDPAEPQKVIEFLGNVEPQYLLTTHHHADHSGGNQKICDRYPSIKVYGGDRRIPRLNETVEHGKPFHLGELVITPLFTPGHTLGSVSYFVQDPITLENVVFTGDTLFIGGCGRFFEGTPTDMYKSLIEILGALPEDTKVYCGHEYTYSNLLFAQSVEPNNPDLAKKLQWSQGNSCTVPSTIGEEFKTNPFMRVHQSTLQKHLNESDPVQLMKLLRELKNKF
jgi:hydroxyacylglutathione hydrolase